jgi:hypothetical protein
MTVLELKNYIKNNNVGDDFDIMIQGFNDFFDYGHLAKENLKVDNYEKILEVNKIDKFKRIM